MASIIKSCKSNYRRALCVYIFIVLSTLYELRADNNIFRPIYLDDPISINECQCIEKDDDGFLWIANSEGVIRYYCCSGRMYRLEYNFLRSLHKLSDGSIVILNNFQPLNINIYNPIRDLFDKVDIENEAMCDIVTECGAVDQSNNLWIGTSDGILCYSGDRGDLYHFEEFRGEDIKSLFTIGDMIVFFADSNKLFIAYADWEQKRLIVKSSVESPFVEPPQSALYDTYLRAIHFGTTGEGLYSYDMISHKFTKHSNLNLDNIPIKSIEELNVEQLLIGTDGLGVLKVQRNDFSIVDHYYRTTAHEFSIPSNAIYDLYVDPEQRIYAATYAHGVLVLDSQSLDYELIMPMGKHGEPLLSTVNSIYEDYDGSLLMGTNNGVYSISEDDQQHNLYRFENSISSRNKVILSIQGFDGELYAGGYGSGLLRVDRKERTLRSVECNSRSAIPQFLFTFYNDNNTKLFMGGINSKLISYNHKDNDVVSYGEGRGVTSISTFSATKLIYCADYNLYIFDKISQVATPFKLDSVMINQLDIPLKIHMIRKYYDDIYFATTNCGLLSYNISTHTTASYAEMLGSDYSNIISFEVDQRGDIWLVSSIGMAHIDTQNNYVTCYKRLGEVKASSFVKGASLLTHSGEVMFGTLDGVISINPFTFYEKKAFDEAPQLVDFKISYNSIFQDATLLKLDRPIADVEEFNLSYLQNTFSFSFTQIDFSRFESTPYSWFLEGFDKQWSPVSTQSCAEYRNIPSGNYTFRYRAYRSQNSDEYVENSVQVRIRPPWYWSHYIIAIYILLISIMIYAAIYLYTKKMQYHHTQERIDHYINILHSMLMPITLTKAPIEALHREIGDSSTAAHLLAVVSKSISRMHSLISVQTDFHSIINDAADEHELSLNDYFRDLSDNFWEYALFNNVSLELEIGQPNKVIRISREALNKVMDNLLSNAIKYSNKTSAVVVAISYSSAHWCVSVTNHGVVIPSSKHKCIFKTPYRADNAINMSQPSSGMGLVLTAKLVQVMGGVISFTSSEQQGTTFTVRLPMKIADKPITHTDVMDDTTLADVSDIRTGINLRDSDETVSDTEILIASEDDSDTTISQVDKEFIGQVSDIIRANLSNQDFNVDTLCSKLFMSRSAFYNRMKHITNLTPIEMLRRARMEVACDLLREEKYSILAISEMVGFSDAKYFSKVFYKFYGYYPSKYPRAK
ncbi:MAG: ATP-binding protein [Rikenellaceae bacterium]